jgi:catechol 2,3-dioxygenase-like lactoylglutathione lyase family enzyme
MIDHVSIAVRDLDGCGRFYDAVLTPLGYRRMVVRQGTIGFGKKYPEFWLNERRDMTPVGVDSGSHVALRAADRISVDAFHDAALRAGAISDGAPGPRPEYSAGYYAAFVRDPEGNRIEAVTFLPRSP